MEQKTKIKAENGRQDMEISRDFDLPLELLFRAYVEPELIAQWMGTKVLQLESRTHGGYLFETTDPKGNVVFRASGVIHAYVPAQKITRTFEMEGTPFGVQLEIYTFEKLTEDTSRVRMHVIYESVAQRDQVLQLPFRQGLNMAHDRMEALLHKLQSGNE